jgi:formylglycine-generating enzyme required for sulfatase activity
MIRLSLSLTALIAAITTTTATDATASDPLQKWWNGLDAPSHNAEARGIVALRSPVHDRVRLPGGRFLMGSTPREIEEALNLTRREILQPCPDPMPDPMPPLCERIVRLFLSETVAHIVELRPFAIDRTEVSVGAYDKCVENGACLRAQFPMGDPHFDRPNLPVTFVNWDNAKAYCAFIGGRLPTEAEWEFAARGENHRIFPWGNVYNPHLANHGALYAAQTTDATDGYEFVAPVDAFLDGATPEGVLQMAGNVSEWVFDFYALDMTAAALGHPEAPQGYDGAAQNNPTGPKTGIVHVVRGGSYEHGAAFVRAAGRGVEWTVAPDVGFRCAYD